MEAPVVRRSLGKSLRKGFRIFVFCVIAVAALAIYWFYFNVKSNGDRKGVLIKFSHKGNIFKTDEGEMWLGCRQTVNAEKYFFSVTNDSIASILKNLQDECMQVEYKEFRATLPWRGDTRYIVYGVKKIEPHFSR
ncbi:MAG TPA: hypothetical protein VFT15_07665 [Chitinophagaceae bacterium]|nr:hypothetical protein [Chitinophagaceae bacterium]